jgi:glycosyltransferase involved in cell wall biosynthesis
MANLLGVIGERGIGVDLLRIRGHGPYLDPLPANARVVELGRSHVNTSLWPLARYLRRERPAAMLTDKDRVNRTAIMANLLAGRRTRLIVRTGTTVSRDLPKKRWLERQVQRASMRWLYRLADGVVLPSQNARQDLLSVSGLPEGFVHAVPSPVITQAMRDQAAEPVPHPWFGPGRPPVILGVGELSGRKDFATLIRAFSRLRAHCEARLVILGEGNQRQTLQALARDLGVAEEVDLPGFVENPYPFMAGAGVFALASLYEGAPVVLMEALGLGTPVVATDCPSGPREIMREGSLGPLVPVGDDAAMAEGLLSMLREPPSRAALRNGVAPFEAEASADAYLSLLGLGEELGDNT